LENPGCHKLRGEQEPNYGEANSTELHCRETISKRVIWVTVPQTDTGRWGEYPKALERTLVKELGKIPP
jgi:hypothetical protein